MTSICATEGKAIQICTQALLLEETARPSGGQTVSISATEGKSIQYMQALLLEGTARPFGGQKANPSTTEGKQVAGRVSLAWLLATNQQFTHAEYELFYYTYRRV